MVRNDTPELADVLARQHDIVSRTQALATGLDARDIRLALDTGRWRLLLPNVYAARPGELNAEQKRTAAGLYTAGTGQVTGFAALDWHALRDLASEERVHILVPHSTRRVSYNFVRVQRTRRPDALARRAGGYDVCSTPRAVADACRGLSDGEAVRSLVAEAVARGWATVTELRRELDLAGASRTRPLRLALRQFCDVVS
jgi:hypothetical protein